MKTQAIPCPHLPSTRGDATVLATKVVLPPQALPAVFATGQSMKTNRVKVFLVQCVCFQMSS